jgi:Tol biopolymer transport system component
MADVSADGRYIAFESQAALVAADDNQRADIYVLDRTSARVTLESADLDAECSNPRISGDGRYIVFEARLAGFPQIVLRDRTASSSRLLTTGGAGSENGGWSRSPDISDDGRIVVFSSAATTLVEGPDANGALEDVYAMELSTGGVRRISVSALGAQPSRGTSILPAVSADGRWVAFASTAPLDPGRAQPNEESPVRRIYLRDLTSGTTVRVSRSLRGGRLDGDSTLPALSGDGRYIAFASEATNIVDGDANRSADVFVFDREKETTMLVSRAVNGAVANGASTNPSVSADGRFIAFQSDAANMVCASRCSQAQEDLNLLWDTFVFDSLTAKIVRISEDELGGWMDWSAGISIDGTGSVVAFSSRHPRDASDRLEDVDLFVRALRPRSR